MDNATVELVRSSSLFENIREETFTQVIAAGQPRCLEEDQHFFIQGDRCSHAYVLTAGRVKMCQLTPGGKQITLRIMTAGQTFGGIALLDPPAGYPATAQALCDSTAISWETRQLRELVEKDTTISLNVMKLMHGYISELQDRQQALVSDRVDQRIARSILKLAVQTGRKIEEGLLIDMPVSRQDIAEMSGTTVYTVSRTLNEWERGDLLFIGRERVIIRSPHALVAIADDLTPRD